MPKQIIRLLIVFVVIVGGFLIVRYFLVPESFGELGHYRKAAIDEIIEQEIQYAGQDVCVECHDDIGLEKSAGYHRDLSCEVCHGPAADHTNAPDEFTPLTPNKRKQCPVCHEYLPSRPTGFPQIISDSHNPIKPCITCHNPHSPVPPEVPKECSACHAEISRAKTVSHHAYVPCQRCHEVSEEHKINPRMNLPTKPTKREFCGECHSENAESELGIPKINIDTHNKKYVCWQCHYPHLP